MQGSSPPETRADAAVRAGVDISDEEVDALLDKKAVPPGVARAFDLVARDAARGRMPVLDRVNERWIDAFRAQLTNLMRRPLEVSLREVQLAPFGDWQARLPVPSSVSVFTVAPWERNAIVAVEGRLLFVLVDAYYGGVGRVPSQSARTELTPTETRLTGIIAESLTKHFQHAFTPIASLEFRHQATELGARHVAIATPSETVVVTHVDIALNGTIGSIYLVQPLASFENVLDELAEGVKAVSTETRRRWRASLEDGLGEAPLELACVFLETGLTVRDLLRLRPGDILPIEMPKTATLCAGEKALLNGKFGQSRGYNAVRIIEAVKRNAAKEKG